MKTLHLLLLTICFFFFSASAKPQTTENKQNESSLTKVYRGQIISKAFVNKKNYVNPDILDYYFRHYGKNYFIKLQNCDFDGAIASFNNAFVYAKGEIRNGLWDTNDPNKQSRVGEYFVFTELKLAEQPLSISFQDGNNNRYVAKPNLLTYDPVRIQESSSGYYSGGKEQEKVLNLEDFMNIFFMIEELIESSHELINERVKGSIQLAVLHLNKENELTFIFSDTPEVQAVKAYMDGLLGR